MRSRTSWLLAATIGLGAITGCGGGGGSDISKADFVKKANAVCKKGNAELTKTMSGIDPSDKDAAVSAIKDKLVPNIQGQIDDIKDIGFPKADKSKLSGIFDDAQSALDKIKDDPEAMLTASDPFADTNKAFTAYGLTDCASG